MVLFLTTLLQFLFLLAPFFVVSMFLSLTKGYGKMRKQRTINRAIVAAAIVVLVLFFFGQALFKLLGITLDAFRVGAGALLFLSAVSLVNSGTRPQASTPDLGDDDNNDSDDVAVVPLAIPTMIGPATIGAILVIGADLSTWFELLIGLFAVLSALALLRVLLQLAQSIENVLGQTGLNILSKMTGLVLAAMAAQIIFTGARNLWLLPGLT